MVGCIACELNKAIIPIGGLGVRLYPLTVDTSKPMVRFLNKHLIDFIVMKLARQGIKEFYLGVSGYVNYVGLIDHLGTGAWVAARLGKHVDEIRIRYQPNVVTSGNAESVKVLMDYYDINEPVLVVQGDIIFDVDLTELLKFHCGRGAYMTIVLKELEDVELIKQYGVADLKEGEGLLKGFVEKPTDLSKAPSRFVNTGIYLLSPEFRDFFHGEVGKAMLERGETDFGRHVIPKLIELGYGVYGYVTRGYWFDIGTPESYVKAVKYLLKNLSDEELEVDFTYGGLKMQGRKPLSRRLQQALVERIAKGDVVVEGDVLLGRHIQVGSDVKIVNSVIDHYTILRDGVEVVESIVMDRCYVGEGASIINSVVGRHAVIGRGAKVVNSVLGNDVTVGDEATVVNSMIWPHKRLAPSSTVKDLKVF